MQDNNTDNFHKVVKEKLKIGQVIKNYKELCKILNEKKRSGKSKILQIKNWERYFTFERNIIQYIVTEIYDYPMPKINLHKKEFEQLNISIENENKIGVYSITLDNDIYIGSTIKGFRERFMQHRNKDNPLKHTYDMIQNGGIFEAIWIAEEDTEELTIRQKEKEYIECYIGLSEWNVINLKYGYKTAYNNIKIKKNDYDTVVSLLQNNNIYYKG